MIPKPVQQDMQRAEAVNCGIYQTYRVHRKAPHGLEHWPRGVQHGRMPFLNITLCVQKLGVWVRRNQLFGKPCRNLDDALIEAKEPGQF